MRVIASNMHAISPTPFHEGGVGMLGARIRLFIYTLPTNKILNYDSALTTVAVFKTDNCHAVPLETATPAIEAVFGRDAARSDEFGVAGRADIVVAWEGIGNFAGAGKAMVAG